jgi:hypothetical protein
VSPFRNFWCVGSHHDTSRRRPRKENNDRCENDFPAVHHVSSTSTGARTVRSRSPAKSSVDLVKPLYRTTAPVTIVTARQAKAARHIVGTRNFHMSVAFAGSKARIRAITRFSKANGTSDRSAAISPDLRAAFRNSSYRGLFICGTLDGAYLRRVTISGRRDRRLAASKILSLVGISSSIHSYAHAHKAGMGRNAIVSERQPIFSLCLEERNGRCDNLEF